MKVTPKISEANVQRAICDLLSAKKIRYHRMNAGDRLMESKGKTYRIRGHEKGCADILALVNTGARVTWPLYATRPVILPLYIEVKRPGGKQSAEQWDFETAVNAYGCGYLLADSIDVVVEWLKERGL
jgi:hypothetical protein